MLNPGAEIEYPKSQYKKYIKDVVSGTLERSELIEETININTIKLMKKIIVPAKQYFSYLNPKKKL